MLTFVTFHVDIPAGMTVPLMPKAAYVTDPVAFLNPMFQSAELFHPGCEKILLTDAKTIFQGLIPEVKLVRIPDLPPAMPAFARLLAQIAYVEQCPPPKKIVFLDYDVLVNCNLDFLFKNAFDVALTYRPNRVQLFNAGIVFLKESPERKGSQFLRRIAEKMVKDHPNFIPWQGHQIALLTFIDPAKFFVRESDLMHVKGFDILFLETDIYNYTPPRGAPLVEMPDKKLIHFKDDRKPLLEQYWEQFLKPK